MVEEDALLNTVMSVAGSGVVAVFESIFRLCPSESITENEGDVLKAMVKVDFVHKTVSYKFSKPVPNK